LGERLQRGVRRRAARAGRGACDGVAEVTRGGDAELVTARGPLTARHAASGSKPGTASMPAPGSPASFASAKNCSRSCLFFSESIGELREPRHRDSIQCNGTRSVGLLQPGAPSRAPSVRYHAARAGRGQAAPRPDMVSAPRHPAPRSLGASSRAVPDQDRGRSSWVQRPQIDLRIDRPWVQRPEMDLGIDLPWVGPIPEGFQNRSSMGRTHAGSISESIFHGSEPSRIDFRIDLPWVGPIPEGFQNRSSMGRTHAPVSVVHTCRRRTHAGSISESIFRRRTHHRTSWNSIFRRSTHARASSRACAITTRRGESRGKGGLGLAASSCWALTPALSRRERE
jgi:hypothetical protein